jgi:hypothetical protein
MGVQAWLLALSCALWPRHLFEIRIWPGKRRYECIRPSSVQRRDECSQLIPPSLTRDKRTMTARVWRVRVALIMPRPRREGCMHWGAIGSSRPEHSSPPGRCLGLATTAIFPAIALRNTSPNTSAAPEQAWNASCETAIPAGNLHARYLLMEAKSQSRATLYLHLAHPLASRRNHSSAGDRQIRPCP